jgi:hypothetical protein
MMRYAIRAFSLVVSVLAITPAWAFCYEPSYYESTPSSFYKTKPRVPYCLSQYSYSQEHTCERYELDSYFDEVDDYVKALTEHHSKLVDYANATAGHANDFLKYAECEAKEVASQHE